MNRTRRSALAGIAAVGSVGVAGCLGGGVLDSLGGDGESSGDTDGSGDGDGSGDDNGDAVGDERPPTVEADYHLAYDAEELRSEALSGGVGKDGIPSIDEPSFRPIAEMTYAEGIPVFGVARGGEAKAYPRHVLSHHEIVNDEIGGEAVSITYCPLTGTALGFLRGDTELGVSGRLVNSNLVMYDRQSDSFWPQMLGAAINGPRKGEGLEEIRVVWTTWERWQARHEDTQVLSSDTGYMRNYRGDPYGSYTPVSGYYEPNAERLFPVQNTDDRYPPKREVFGFRTDDIAVAVDQGHLADAGTITFEQGGDWFLVIHDPDLDTGWVYRGDEAIQVPESFDFGPGGPQHQALEQLEPVNGYTAMWFAWAAFYPDTRVIDGT